MVGRFASRDHCAIYVVGTGTLDLRQLALSRRFDIGEARGLGRIDIAPGDEQSAFHFFEEPLRVSGDSSKHSKTARR
jgi:hypothetical protein